MYTLVRKPLLPLSDAIVQLLSTVVPLGETETVSILEADGRVLANDMVSGLQVPPFDNSAMDGYAVRIDDVLHAAGAPLPVSQRIAAGTLGSELAFSTIARIFTGAPIPEGADAVVLEENCIVLEASDAHGRSQVHVSTTPFFGQNIRHSGEDVTRGDVVLAAGYRLDPASLGLAASIGMATVQVVRQPKVALFSTGNELIMPGTVAPQDMPPGAIYNSNRFFLHNLLRRMGCLVTDLGIVPDSSVATQAALREAAASNDLVLTSGGVSVGEEDHIKPSVESLGHLDLWQLAIKPGKPFAHGRIGAAHFIGLPGNPVASLVTFFLLVRPFLLRMQGVQDVAMKMVPVRADFNWPRAGKRREFLRVRRNAMGGLDLFSNQSSGVLTSAVWGDGLVDIEPGRPVLYGDTVCFIPFAELWS